MNLIADNISAIFDLCCVGDDFLRNMFHSLQAWITQAGLSRKVLPPYIKEYFNVQGFFFRASHLLQSATALVINSVIEGLNTREKLPKIMLIVLDKDIIQNLDQLDYGVYKQLSAVVNWLTCQIDIAIRQKRLQLCEKKPGAVFNQRFPAVIYVSMLCRIKRYNRKHKIATACALRRKFNDILNESAARLNHHVMNISNCSSPDHFDQFSNLTHKGKSEFWNEVDNLIERFDQRKITLQPKPCVDRPHNFYNKGHRLTSFC